MKEDILEQIADDYLQFKGYFTTHNVRFKPDTAHPDTWPTSIASHPMSTSRRSDRRRHPDRMMTFAPTSSNVLSVRRILRLVRE